MSVTNYIQNFIQYFSLKVTSYIDKIIGDHENGFYHINYYLNILHLSYTGEKMVV